MFHKSLLLTGLAVLPTINSIPVTTTNNTVVQLEDNELQEQDAESCTVMYVGKKVSDNGKPYCCRCGDTNPKGININATIFEHNQLANVLTKGKNGFEWTMPSTTYRYISTPRNPLVKNGLHWEVSAINEMGVASSATLSCYANANALEADPYVTTGISEDNLAQIMGATATSARNAMETIAKIIDEQGSAESNIIMAMDKDEAWLMEIYTGHQYAAIKLPEDKACTIGNEFFLNTLKDYDDKITSPNLFSLPKDNHFAVYEGEETDENMHMFETYAKRETDGTISDSTHMRTWRGISLFVDPTDEYKSNKKYDPFFTPTKKLTVQDIITFYRDRFESILNNPSDPNYTIFKKAYDKGTLRCVGVDRTYQVHLLSVNPDLPKEIAAEETIALCSANYTPFVPLNAGVYSMNEYYTHVSKSFGYDENSAYYIFKRLNGLADTDRTNYGLPIEAYLANHEGIWSQHYNDILKQIKDKSLDVQRNVITNYCLSAQAAALEVSNALFNDLMWHIINPYTAQFKPFASLEYYSYIYGWDYSLDGEVATLTSGNDTVTVDFTYTEKPAKGWVEGTITKNTETPKDVRVSVKEQVPCIDYDIANQYLASGHSLVTINWQDFYIENNSKSWVLPVAISVPTIIVASVVTPIVVVKALNKKKIKVNKKNKK